MIDRTRHGGGAATPPPSVAHRVDQPQYPER